MEPHPIPQNVTSFQFKLVGDMTLKQFMYLATGSAISYLLFLFLAPPAPIVAWPMIIISASLGVAFAFLPIGSRPLDHWLAAFLKAIYSPTKRVWRKNNKSFKDEPLFGSRLVMYLSSTAPPIPMPIPAQTLRAVGIASGDVRPENLPSEEELKKTVELARQAQNLQMKIIQTERALSQIKEQAQKPARNASASVAGGPTPIAVDYGQQVNNILADLQNLVNQASVIKEQLQLITEPEAAKLEAVTPQALQKERVKVIIPVRPKQTQLALTTFPNVINGIVKDSQENYLEGVVSVIYDKEGLPVRALKTNKLGQFTGSTPLPNGTYTLELEKDGFTFDVLQIELSGQVLPSLVITAKN